MHTPVCPASCTVHTQQVRNLQLALGLGTPTPQCNWNCSPAFVKDMFLGALLNPVCLVHPAFCTVYHF
jgi:hypothetical protein